MTCEQCQCGTPMYFNCAKDAIVFCPDCGKSYTVGRDGKLERDALEILAMKES